MPTRSSILCGHCAAEPGTVACPGCGLEVCTDCATDRASCSQARAVEFRLGLGARLRSIDPTCHWGLATNVMGVWTPIDLRTLRPAEMPRHVSLVLEPGIRPDGSIAGAIENGGFQLGPRDYGRGVTGELDRSGAVIVGFDDVKVSVFDLAAEVAVGLDPPRTEFDPFPRRIVQAATHDSGRILCATYGELALFTSDGKRQLQSIELDGFDTLWLGLAGDTIAALVTSGGGFRKREIELALWRASDGDPIARARLGKVGKPLADLSGDGRTTVAADDRSAVVVISENETGPRRLEGHSDGLCALGVATDGSRLVSGDFDNRVIARERGSDGFATRLESAALQSV